MRGGLSAAHGIEFETGRSWEGRSNGRLISEMSATIQTLVLLLAVIAAVAVAAERLKIPPAILLVVTGVALALIPGLPAIEIAPEFVLLIVLPPIIYSSAVAMSWREFRFNLRPITLLAFGCVIFTTVAVAAATHYLMNLAWPLGFLLGAIVSPPDAVAPLSIARRMRIPRRLMVVLEGEGLANDATALILYRFAVAAVSAGTFSFAQAGGLFAAIVVGEIAWGIAVGWLSLRLRRWVGDPRIEITLSVITPFLAYWPPAEIGGSGVLATMVAATRLQGIFFWDFINYLIEGMVFLITGLQARGVVASIRDHSLSELATSATVVAAVVIVARFVWVFPATYLPRWLIPALRRRDPSPPWQWAVLLGFTGIRGIVSLVAALAIPLTTQSDATFPGRDLILFLAFSVILVTLVGQGLLLPWVIGLLDLANAGRREVRANRMEEHGARRQAVATAIERLDQLAIERSLPEEILQPIRAVQQARLRHLGFRGEGALRRSAAADLHDEIDLELIGVERQSINDLFRDGKITDESRRRIERELDLREARLANNRADE
jgi:CPA1 family monovalent cation:H+ antiporter